MLLSARNLKLSNIIARGGAIGEISADSLMSRGPAQIALRSSPEAYEGHKGCLFRDRPSQINI